MTNKQKFLMWVGAIFVLLVGSTYGLMIACDWIWDNVPGDAIRLRHLAVWGLFILSAFATLLCIPFAMIEIDYRTSLRKWGDEEDDESEDDE